MRRTTQDHGAVFPAPTQERNSRYYSRTGWERKSGEDIEEFKARALAR